MLLTGFNWVPLFHIGVESSQEHLQEMTKPVKEYVLTTRPITIEVNNNTDHWKISQTWLRIIAHKRNSRLGRTVRSLNWYKRYGNQWGPEKRMAWGSPVDWRAVCSLSRSPAANVHLRWDRWHLAKHCSVTWRLINLYLHWDGNR